MALAAHRAAGEDMVGPNAQKCFQFAVDADIDVLASPRADKVQPFHVRSPYYGFAVAVFYGLRKRKFTMVRSHGDIANPCALADHSQVSG